MKEARSAAGEAVEPWPGRGGAVLVTGTGTGVGKTYVAALLVDFLRRRGAAAGYQKWVSTGGEEESGLPADLACCLRVAGMEYDPALLDMQVPYRFRFPASPHLAAEMEGRLVDPERLEARFREMAARNDVLVVEGVGGILVPLRRDLLLADFVARLGMPVLVVASSGLGTLNHTLLTLEALRRRNISVPGVVFSDPDGPLDETLVADNLKTVAEIGRAPVLGRLPRCAAIEEARAHFIEIGRAVLAAIPPHPDPLPGGEGGNFVGNPGGGLLT